MAVHGFPLDWNHWQIDAWPEELAEVRAVTSLPLWVSEVGVSSFGAEEVQEFGLRAHRGAAARPRRAHPLVQPVRPAEGLAGHDPPPRSGRLVVLPPLPHGPGSRGRHAEARHRVASREHAPELGLCQWFHFEDPRLDDAVRWLDELGVRHLRTGLSLGRQPAARARTPGSIARCARSSRFEVTVTFCFTPESAGLRPHHTSPPRPARVCRLLRPHDPPLRDLRRHLRFWSFF